MDSRFFNAGTLIAALACLAGAAIPSNKLSEVEEAQGFVSLFDGSLKSFNASFVNYRKLDSTNVALPPSWKVDPAGSMITDGAEPTHVRSTQKFANFDFRFDYRCDGDGGFFYRFNLSETSPWYTGVEYQVFNDADNCKTCAGAAVDLYNPVPLIYRPFSTGEWNHARVVAVGDSVEHWLNGTLVVAYKYHTQDFWTRFDVSRWASTSLTFKTPGNKWGGFIENGYLGFQALANVHWQMQGVRVNGASPRLGPDRWWSATASTTGIAAPAKSELRKQAQIGFLRQGTFIFRPGQGAAVNASGRSVAR
jgi:hypothetical protein